jgi:VIT1/CCC1 family predicted Fe2+/Mn2+ transporter
MAWGLVISSLMAVLSMLSKNPFAGPNIKVVLWFLVLAVGSYVKLRQARSKEEFEHHQHGTRAPNT